MTRVIVNEMISALLGNFSRPIELCDETGRVLARVYPADDVRQGKPWEPTFTEEDLQRQEEVNEKRFTTAEVLARLESNPES